MCISFIRRMISEDAVCAMMRVVSVPLDPLGEKPAKFEWKKGWRAILSHILRLRSALCPGLWVAETGAFFTRSCTSRMQCVAHDISRVVKQ